MKPILEIVTVPDASTNEQLAHGMYIERDTALLRLKSRQNLHEVPFVYLMFDPTDEDKWARLQVYTNFGRCPYWTGLTVVLTHVGGFLREEPLHPDVKPPTRRPMAVLQEGCALFNELVELRTDAVVRDNGQPLSMEFLEDKGELNKRLISLNGARGGVREFVVKFLTLYNRGGPAFGRDVC